MNIDPMDVIEEILDTLDKSIPDMCKDKGLSVPEGVCWLPVHVFEGMPKLVLEPCFELATKRFIAVECELGGAFIFWMQKNIDK